MKIFVESTTSIVLLLLFQQVPSVAGIRLDVRQSPATAIFEDVGGKKYSTTTDNFESTLQSVADVVAKRLLTTQLEAKRLGRSLNSEPVQSRDSLVLIKYPPHLLRFMTDGRVENKLPYQIDIQIVGSKLKNCVIVEQSTPNEMTVVTRKNDECN